MKIQRAYTKAGESPYEAIPFRLAKQRDHATRTVRWCSGRIDAIEVPSGVVAGRRRRAGAEIFPQGRVCRRGSRWCARRVSPRWLCKGGWPTIEGPGSSCRRSRALWRRDQRPAGVRPAGGHLDLLGLQARLFRQRGRCPRLLSTSIATCWPSRCRRRTHRNGSIRGSTGPMA